MPTDCCGPPAPTVSVTRHVLDAVLDEYLDMVKWFNYHKTKHGEFLHPEAAIRLVEELP